MKKSTITYDQLRQLVFEGQAPAAPAAAPAAPAAQAAPQQGGQQAAADPQAQKEQGGVQKALGALWETVKKAVAGKQGGARTVAEIFKTIIEAGSMTEAIAALAEMKKEKEAAAKQEEQQQAAAQGQEGQEGQAQPEQQQAAESSDEEIDEGLLDRAKAKFAAWGTGAKAAAQNVGNAVKSKVTGQEQDAPKNDVYGAMQTGKFSTLIQQYIGKIQDLQKKCQDYAGKTQDKAEQQKCQSMIADMAEFVKNGQEALDQTKDELKKSGYNRKEQGQGDDQKQGDAKKDGQLQGDADKKQDDNKKDEQKPEGNENKDAESGEEKQEVKENQRFTLTIGQLRRLVAECRTDEGFWDKVKGAAKGVAQAAKGVGQSVKQAATNAAQTSKGAAKELGQAKTWTTKVWTSADYADKLSRIIGELNADLKDCGWSAKRNPGLAKVITKIEQDANKIHGQGEHGTQSNLDKIKHAAGKMVGGMVASAAQAAAIGVLMAPLRKFMSPRWYAALVAFSTVMLKYFVKKLGDKDLDVDKKEEQSAQASATTAAQPTNESVEVPNIVFEHAMREAMRAYKRGFAISEDTKLTLTIGQLRRLVKEGVAAGVAKDAALDAVDSAIFGGAPVAKATEKGAEAYLKNDASVAEEPKPEEQVDLNDQIMNKQGGSLEIQNGWVANFDPSQGGTGCENITSISTTLRDGRKVLLIMSPRGRGLNPGVGEIIDAATGEEVELNAMAKQRLAGLADSWMTKFKSQGFKTPSQLRDMAKQAGGNVVSTTGSMVGGKVQNATTTISKVGANATKSGIRNVQNVGKQVVKKAVKAQSGVWGGDDLDSISDDF